MKITKKLLSLMLMLCGSQSLWGTVDPAAGRGSLVYRDEEGKKQVQSWFQGAHPDFLCFMGLGYTLTKRDSNGGFLHGSLMLRETPDCRVAETGNHWLRDRNFSGIHGLVDYSSWGQMLVGSCLECFTGGAYMAEIDSPGFVALRKPTEESPYYLIAVVLRGSQGEDFQPGSGILGPSWGTNFDAVACSITAGEFGIDGQVCAGYTLKMRSCNFTAEDFISMIENGEIEDPLIRHNLSGEGRPIERASMFYPLNQSMRKILDRIPPEDLDRVRVVVTGHSQGGGLAQIALLQLIHDFGHVFPGFVNNVDTPYFFGYFLSAPRVAADKETADAYNQYVGGDNMLNHSAFRDVVTVACLPGYVALGHLACDAPCDVFYRGICSEIAHRNRRLLMRFFQRQLDRDLFDTTDPNFWLYRNEPDLRICWKEIQHIIARERIGASSIEPEFLIQLMNRALGNYRMKHGIESDLLFDGGRRLLRNELDWNRIRDICRGDLLPEEVQLTEESHEMLRRVSDNISGGTVSFSPDGANNTLTLVDTVCDLTDAARGRQNRGGVWECLRRVCCCSCCCGEEEDLEPVRDIFDPKFEVLVNGGLRPRPAGILPVIAYLHYGSKANSSGQQLFDAYLPSRRLDLALENGEKLALGNPIGLRSEYDWWDRPAMVDAGVEAEIEDAGVEAEIEGAGAEAEIVALRRDLGRMKIERTDED
jgi:hypothetical protein